MVWRALAVVSLLVFGPLLVVGCGEEDSLKSGTCDEVERYGHCWEVSAYPETISDDKESCLGNYGIWTPKHCETNADLIGCCAREASVGEGWYQPLIVTTRAGPETIP